MPAVAKEKRIADDVLGVLGEMEFDGPNARLSGGQLDRKLYVRTNEVLEALGGKWNKKSKAHVFEGDAAQAIESAVVTGCFVKPGDYGFFPSPPAVVEHLADLAGINLGMTCLEPSAGHGAIVAMLLSKTDLGSVAAVELMPKNAEIVEALTNVKVTVGDFLSISPDWKKFDRVVMNPPFAPAQADIDHVLHAHKFLKPGGRLVSVMASGVLFRDNRKARDFRAFVDSKRGEISELPDGSFKISGTNVSTVVVVIPACPGSITPHPAQ